jgi:hypothetical protein
MTSLPSAVATPLAALGDDPRTLVLVLLLCGVLLLGAVVIAVAQRWRRAVPERLSPSDQLAQFRSLYEAGELTREEFERLRSLLGAQIRQEAGVGPAAQGPAPAAGAVPPPKPAPPPDAPLLPPPPIGPVDPPPPPAPPGDGVRPA